MAIDPRLLEFVVCPACHGELSPTDDEQGLRCGSCRRVYPVRDEIPVLLVEEALRPEEG